MIVLDTHTWIWWVSAIDQLSSRARGAIESAERIAVSPISCFEVASLVRRDRIGIPMGLEAWLAGALSQPRVEVAPLTLAVAVRAGSLPRAAPNNPADRIVVATALDAGWPVVTIDRKIRESGVVETIW